MKTIVVVALLTLSTVLRAQVGAKVDSIAVPEFGGAKVLHHCKVIELQADTVKVSHDDGVSVVALRFLPADLQKNLNDRNEAEAALRKKALAEAEKVASTASEPTASSETKGVASSDPVPAATAETGGSAEASATTQKDPEMMARGSHSKANNDNPNNYPVATIPGPTVRRSPRVRLIPIPVPYYRPVSPPIVTTPQSGGPGTEDY